MATTSTGRSAKSTADQARGFARAAKEGRARTARIPRAKLEAFLTTLIDEGVRIGKDLLEQIPDPAVRDIVKTVVLATAGAAAIGGAIGLLVGGPKAAPAGALIGAGLGLVTGVAALVLCGIRTDGQWVFVSVERQAAA